MNTIELKDLCKSFGKIQVLKNIDLELKSGEVTALMGPNGSGKTTLLKSILGLVIPDSGKILVNNADVKNDYHYRNLIGYMPQIANYPENMKVAATRNRHTLTTMFFIAFTVIVLFSKRKLYHSEHGVVDDVHVVGIDTFRHERAAVQVLYFLYPFDFG